MKLTRKILASVLALVMVLLMLPAAFAAEDNVHVLDVSTDLEALAADAANEGKEIVVNDYFTVILGSKTKIDSSKKTFDDGYQATQRLNFQHKTNANDNGVILPAVKFTTSGAATIKLWWVEGGDDNRQFAILNEAGEEVTRTNDTLEKNGLCISELALEAAGTYYLGTPDGSNYLFKMEVTEAASEVEPPVEPVACEHTNTELKDAKAATCTEAGYTGDTYCADCGEKLAAGEEIAMLEHTYVDGKCACGAEDPNYVAPEKVTLTVGNNSLEVNENLVIKDQQLDAVGDYAFIIYTYNFKANGGTIGFTNGHGEAIVVNKDGVIVRIYDGANGKYYDAENTSGVTGVITGANYDEEAFASLQEGETVIIAPHTTANSADGGSRKFLLGNRTMGATVSGLGLTFGETPVEPEPTPDTGDAFAMVVALMAISGTALVVLKKKI